MGELRGGQVALAGRIRLKSSAEWPVLVLVLLEGIVAVGTVGRRRMSKVFGVGHGAGSGSRPLRLENGKMGPDVVPEDPSRLEKEKAFGKKFMNRAIGRIRRCRNE